MKKSEMFEIICDAFANHVPVKVAIDNRYEPYFGKIVSVTFDTVVIEDGVSIEAYDICNITDIILG